MQMVNSTCNCTCQKEMPSRQQLMDLINHASFAALEMMLYLDTHPTDMEAMAFFKNNPVSAGMP